MIAVRLQVPFFLPGLQNLLRIADSFLLIHRSDIIHIDGCFRTVIHISDHEEARHEILFPVRLTGKSTPKRLILFSMLLRILFKRSD